jgi:hypothetical protein
MKVRMDRHHEWQLFPNGRLFENRWCGRRPFLSSGDGRLSVINVLLNLVDTDPCNVASINVWAEAFNEGSSDAILWDWTQTPAIGESCYQALVSGTHIDV